MQNLPRYLNVYLGLEQGDPRSLDEDISNAIKKVDKELRQYRTEEEAPPAILADWETLKKTEKSDEELYQKYLDFEYSFKDIINWIGQRSGLILVSDMNTYYFSDSALSNIPEALVRLVSIGNLVRNNLNEAEDIVLRWNNTIADALAQGRTTRQRPFEGDPRNIPMSMIASGDLQLIRNNRILLESDRDRISAGLTSAMEGKKRKADQYEKLEASLDRYQNSVAVLFEQYPTQTAQRQTGSNITSTTAADFLGTVSMLSTDLCQLWAETFNSLEAQVRRNTMTARADLILYLAVVLVSLGIAIWFVAFITLDINKSVRILKTLFKGLNENDLTLSLKINSKDEFGDLMTAFNGFLNILRSTFGSFKQSAQLVANSVFDLSSSSREISTTANEQSSSVSEIVSTMEGSKNLSEQIAFKTTEVANLARETQDLSSKGAELREMNQTMMEDIRDQNQKIISEIRNLSDMIIRINEAIRIIDGIADQTKLIAFNASLEASSSGEAGARFSVVASEIRRFADNVVESTREIKQKIEEVQGESQTLIAEANNGSRQIEIGYERMSEQKIVFEHIVENSQNVATRSQQISNLSKQQELASSQIFTALKEISAGVKQFVIATSSTSKIADSLNGMSEDLKGRVEKYKTET
jgi:methyl-accepting chemotaxis protein